MKIELDNGNILVEAIKREDALSATGLYIPTEDLEDEQVSQGTVIQDAGKYLAGDIVMFHKVLPVDVNMKLDGDEELRNYFFINAKDIICKIYA